MLDRLQKNLTQLQSRITAACARAKRPADSVTLVAVTKYAQWEWVRGLYDLGLRDFGESRPQQLVERARLLPGDVRWHLIGHLQRNKVALVLPHAWRIHSVDSVRLARQISGDAGKLGQPAAVFLEVNLAGEATKDGFSTDELRQAWPEIAQLPHLSFEGLMGMAPLVDDPKQVRPIFAGLRLLRDELAASREGHPLASLSMGMSGDFEVAIEEGATHVRIGSSLFEGLAENP